MTDIEQPTLITARVEDSTILPRTLEIVATDMKVRGADATMFEIYGRDLNDRKVWCATFADGDEATIWVQSSKMFGRPVTGYVMAGEVKKETSAGLLSTSGEILKAEKGGEMSDGAMAVGNADSEPAGKPN
jgi:hypothetical protein